MAARRSTVLTVVAAVLAAVPLAAAGAAASPGRAATPVPKLGKGGRVIVVLRDQTHPGEFRGVARLRPATSLADARAEQAQVAAAIRSSGGQVRYRYRLINALAATVTPAEARSLAARGDVAEVIPDSVITAPALPTPTPTPRHSPHANGPSDIDASGGVAPPPNTCPANPNDVQLEPEALAVTRADSADPSAPTARSLGYDGSGVTVAFMADGIDINNPEFLRNGRSIFSDYQDFSGDGPNAPTDGAEAFIDASAIAAQGNQTYDISHFSDLPLDQPCLIKIEGEAPGVNLVGLKVFNNGYSLTSGFLEAIDYAVTTDHVDVLNQSFGANPIPDTAQDVIRAADEAAVAHGVTVTVSSGDAGITNTIGSPATAPGVIAVGATTTYRFDLQTGYAAARFPGITGWLDDNISALSSGGFNESGGTVTLVAPGELNYAACSTDLNTYAGCTDYAGDGIGVEASGGTSEAAPIVAGVAALVIQAYRQGHGGASPTPAQVKDILTSTADDVDAPANQQGAGLVDAYKAVQLAQAYGSGGTPTGTVIASSASSFHATGQPGQRHAFTDTVTNAGTTPETVSLRTRTLGAYRWIATGKVRLNDNTSPKYVDFQDIPDNYATLTFTVPAGADRLAASIAYRAASLSLAARDRLTLVDPSGNLAAYSLPQGIGNYGHVEVARPEAGTWTAIITSRDSADGGSQGVVHFAAAVANYHRFGTVSPSTLTLAPGQSAKVHLTVPASKTPGDVAGSLVISQSPGAGAAVGPTAVGNPAVTTVPITLRSIIPAGTHHLTGTLTGGNGRDEFPGQMFFFDIQVPRSAPELNATVKIGNPRNTYEAALISPGGNMVAFASNQVLTTSAAFGPVSVPVKGAQLHVASPRPGRWTEIIDFAPTVAGNAISAPFALTTSNTPVTASAKGLPQSKKTVLRKGKTVTAYVSVKNTGPGPESYFLDARTNRSATYRLASITSPFTEAPINPNTDTIPVYVVPTHTSVFAGAAVTNGNAPIQFDSQGPLGDPDIASTIGRAPHLTYRASPVSPGAWDIAPQQAGPFSAPATAEDVVTAAAVKTRKFDPAVRSSTGDLWQVSLDPGAVFNPVTVQPGQTAVIQVKIKPTHKGVVKGNLYVDDTQLLATTYSTFVSPDGNELARLHYAYRVR